MGATCNELCRKFGEFRKAYDVGGMSREQFDAFGATRRTLHAFCKALDDLVAQMRDMMLPNRTSSRFGRPGPPAVGRLQAR